MRIVLFINNWVGWQVGKWLHEQGEDIAGMVLHPEQERAFGEEIFKDIPIPRQNILLADTLMSSETLEKIRAMKADIGISAFFKYILRKNCLDIFPKKCVNIHASFLPYDKGVFANVWTIVDQTPTGVTLHYIDEGVDTGDIIAQCEVQKDLTDTGKTLYRKLEHECVELFKDTWPLLKKGETIRTPQNPNEGTVHRARDVERIDEINPERSYKARELIDILRARTFPPYKSAYVLYGNRKIYLRLELHEEDDE